MREVIEALEALSNQTTALVIEINRLHATEANPQRASGLRLIVLYLATIRAGLAAAADLASRL
jgi:hypothetical protein